MQPRINIITLAVDDLERSLRFYRDGLDLHTEGVSQGFSDHVLFQMQNGLSLVLYERREVIKIISEAENIRSSSECILSHAASGKEEVNDILKRAEAAGAKILRKPEDQPWGYFGYFSDPDGHVWEIIWMPARPLTP